MSALKKARKKPAGERFQEMIDAGIIDKNGNVLIESEFW